MSKTVQEQISQFAKSYPEKYAHIVFCFSHLSIIHMDNQDIMEECSRDYGVAYVLMSDDFFYYDPSESKLNTEAILKRSSEILEDIDLEDLLEEIKSLS